MVKIALLLDREDRLASAHAVAIAADLPKGDQRGAAQVSSSTHQPEIVGDERVDAELDERVATSAGRRLVREAAAQTEGKAYRLMLETGCSAMLGRTQSYLRAASASASKLSDA